MGLWEWAKARGKRQSPAPISPDGQPPSGYAAPQRGQMLTPSAPPQPSAAGFAVLDVETTGRSPVMDRIVEIAIILTDGRGRTQHEWSTRINPEVPMGATEIHGLTDADVANAPTFSVVTSHIVGLLRGRAIVAHNAGFDLGFLYNEFGRSGWAWPTVPYLCTLQESQYFLPELPRRRLADCCAASGIRLDHAHSALADARATSILLQSYLDPRFGRPPHKGHLQLPQLAASVEWPASPGHCPEGAQQAAPLPARAIRAKRQPSSNSASVASMITGISLEALVEHGAPESAPGFLELLLAALEDGTITEQERADLNDAAAALELEGSQVEASHLAVAQALADAAVDDGTISKPERTEIKQILVALGLPESRAAKLLNEAKVRRFIRLSEGLSPLPDGWDLGEPLRVGDNIAFTGCADSLREQWEREATAKGVYVGGVSKKTVFLVSDGTMDGGKAQKARELGTRVVTPDEFSYLLRHLQPYSG